MKANNDNLKKQLYQDKVVFLDLEELKKAYDKYIIGFFMCLDLQLRTLQI